ncbi:hypothetical protein [Zhongshania sp.]|uniref:hypothetical protein n=1 Tax=Zhongshania sp. TaxID=1971902 RepID=UPI001B4E17D7|nr:hypothetical protein [Zhongshania sp.]MBQ0795759.1 hypothetical protein [Zhongshania sp.]
MKIPGDNFGNATPNPQRGSANGNITGGIDAIGEFARSAADVTAKISSNRRIVETAKATSEATLKIDDQAEFLLKQDTDYGTQLARYEEFYKGIDKEYQKGFFKNNPQAYDDWKRRTGEHFKRRGREIRGNVFDQDMAAQRQTLSSSLQDISVLYARGDEEARSKAIEEGLGLIEVANTAGVLTGSERMQEESRFQNTLSRTSAKQDIQTDPSFALEKLRHGGYEGLTADQYVQLENNALTKIETEKTKAAHLLEASSKELVKDTILAFENGYDVSDVEYSQAEHAAAITGRAEDLQVAKAASQYIRLPKTSRESLRPQVTGVKNAELQKALDDADEIINRELDKDGYSFAVRQGVINEVPLDPENPLTVQARLEQVSYLKSHYGRDISPLSDSEADNFIEVLKVMTPAGKVKLAEAFGPSQAIWGQLDKKNASTFAMVGAIGDRQVMSTVFRGQALLDEKLKSVARTDYMPAFDDYVGDVYDGKDRRAVLDAALAYYSASVSDGSSFDDQTFEKALEAVTGGVAEVNGGRVELPRGIESSTFDDYLDGFTPQMVRHFGGVPGMKDAQAAQLISNGTPESYGNGRYIIRSRLGVLQKKDGSPFVITYEDSLSPRAGNRRVRERR